ncbi:hypothetical protein BJ322DRAFT_1109394 [Thelephora terrestris]|uniref:Uncharacterized protein n=1 Tax=Thelephora terrestris TaxID=56493 RepID=A0A9P6L6S3_9AGAM|nr:hypothetical protein BJ322DRAFT_1109394 [Thelephora terrestris]
MAIAARYQRHLSPPTSPSPLRPLRNPDLTTFLLPSNAHLRAPLPRTDSENRREELAKQLARDDEPVALSGSVGGEDASYLLAKAVVGRYVESYLPGIKEQRVVLERGVEVVGENLRRRRRSACGRKGKESALSSLVHAVEVEWMIWSRITPPAVALYAWWVVFAIWRKLDDGERGFLVQFTTHRDKVETWLTWAFAGLVALLCVLALVVWIVVEAIRVFSGYKFGRPRREGDKSTYGS